MNRKINFVIIYKSLVLVSLLKDYLEKKDLFNPILSFNDINEFEAHLESGHPKPDVVLVELLTHPNKGIELIQQLKQTNPLIHTIAYSYNYQLKYSGYMLNSGVKAYCCAKYLSLESLLEIIRNILKHGHSWTPEQLNVIAQLLPPNIPKDICPVDKLTRREKDILPLLAQQKTTKEIANKLFISTKTVDTHKSNALTKTGTLNSVGLVLFALQKKLIDIEHINIYKRD